LRSEKDTEYFNQFGAGGTKIGSLGVVTINLPRLAIRANKDKDIFFEELNLKVSDAIKINAVKRNVLRKRIDNGNQPLYTLGFMDLTKQYATVGLNGINEMVELMGYDILNDDGQKFVVEVLDYINNLNDKATKKYKAPHNTEQTPSESSAVKLAKKDKLLKYQNKYDLYSNQFIPLTVNADMLDRIYLQGLFDSKMSGGSICHINVETEINDESQIVDLINYCAKNGVIYWAINYNLQKCINGHLTVGKNINCNICGGKITDNYTRTVGFLTNVKNWNKTRREVDYPNRIFYDNIKR
jgi:ribonucleoside-triphosphate reductase (formate)